MFYSHSLLAPKGPLSTIWRAAHKPPTKKREVAAVDILSSLDTIMYPPVPLALRLSAHLLLGVVRVYSKKVDYLWDDTKEILQKINSVSLSANVNLPEDATHAPRHTITLPETLELDAMDLDAEFLFDGSPDNHLGSYEEITLTDQIPAEGDHYIAFFIDEDMRMDTSPPADIPEISPMEEDTSLSAPTDNQVGVSDPGPRGQAEAYSQRQAEMRTSQGLPEIEVMRDAVHNSRSEDLPELPDLSKGAFEQDRQFNENMSGGKTLSPIVEDMLVSGGHSEPFQLQPEPPASVASEAAHQGFDVHFSLGHMSPGLAIQPTPPVENPKARPRKRKVKFDNRAIVLSNEFVENSLQDPSSLVGQHTRLPSTDLDFWRFKRLRMEEVFLQPLISGMCTDLHTIYKKDFVSSRVGSIPTEDAPAELMGAQYSAPEPNNMGTETLAPIPDHEVETEHLRCVESHIGPSSILEQRPEDAPAKLIGAQSTALVRNNMDAQSSASIPDNQLEIEHLRCEEGHIGLDSTPELGSSPSRLVPSPLRRDRFTPLHVSSFGPGSMSEVLARTEVLITPDLEEFTNPPSTKLGTPLTRLEDQYNPRDFGFSAIPEPNFAEADDWSLLEAHNTPPSNLTGLEQNEVFDTLSQRIKKVVNRMSPSTPNSKGPPGILSLNKILEGQTRKISARMFFETLVLKSSGLIDVQQEVPYGDIGLKVTQKFYDQL